MLRGCRSEISCVQYCWLYNTSEAVLHCGVFKVVQLNVKKKKNKTKITQCKKIQKNVGTVPGFMFCCSVVFFAGNTERGALFYNQSFIVYTTWYIYSCIFVRLLQKVARLFFLTLLTLTLTLGTVSGVLSFLN